MHLNNLISKKFWVFNLRPLKQKLMQFNNCIKTILTQAGLPECQENSGIVKKWFLFSNIHGICQKLNKTSEIVN